MDRLEAESRHRINGNLATWQMLFADRIEHDEEIAFWEMRLVQTG
jgi:hypothetical protein